MRRLKGLGLSAVVLMLAGITQAAPKRQTQRWMPCDAAVCAPAWTSTLVLYVLDVDGAAISSAKVDVVSAANGRSSVVVSDQAGMVALSLMPNSPVRLSVSAAGFAPLAIDEFVPQAGHTKGARVYLEAKPVSIERF